MPEKPVLDPTALENLRALSPADGGDFLREIVEIFLQETPGRMADLERALHAGDAPAITQLAHSIKGSCGNFGATRLAETSLAIEQAAKRGEIATARALGPELAAAFALTQSALERLLADLK